MYFNKETIKISGISFQSVYTRLFEIVKGNLLQLNPKFCFELIKWSYTLIYTNDLFVGFCNKFGTASIPSYLNFCEFQKKNVSPNLWNSVQDKDSIPFALLSRDSNFYDLQCSLRRVARQAACLKPLRKLDESQWLWEHYIQVIEYLFLKPKSEKGKTKLRGQKAFVSSLGNIIKRFSKFGILCSKRGSWKNCSPNFHPSLSTNFDNIDFSSLNIKLSDKISSNLKLYRRDLNLDYCNLIKLHFPVPSLYKNWQSLLIKEKTLIANNSNFYSDNKPKPQFEPYKLSSSYVLGSKNCPVELVHFGVLNKHIHPTLLSLIVTKGFAKHYMDINSNGDVLPTTNGIIKVPKSDYEQITNELLTPKG